MPRGTHYFAVLNNNLITGGFLLSKGKFTNIDVDLPGAVSGSTNAVGINPQGLHQTGNTHRKARPIKRVPRARRFRHEVTPRCWISSRKCFNPVLNFSLLNGRWVRAMNAKMFFALALSTRLFVSSAEAIVYT